MTAMTWSRVTPSFAVRMTMTPVVEGEMACAWAMDGSVDICGAPDLQGGCTIDCRERLFAIMSIGYEAELYSQARRARWRGGVPERCSAPQLSQSSL